MCRGIVVGLLILVPLSFGPAAEPPTDPEGRPLIRKLGTVDVDKVENSPVVFRGKLYRCEWFRSRGCFSFRGA